MAEQLRHLLRMSERPYLTLRVVPAAHGAHAAMSGPFTLMEFAEFRPVAYLDSETSSLFLELPEEIDGVPAHPGGAGPNRAGRGTIEAADCHPGNRARPESRGP